MRILVVALVVIAYPGPIGALALPCDLSPLPLPAEQWRRAVETVLPEESRTAEAGPYRVEDMELAFDPPRRAEWAAAEVVPVVLRLTMDADRLSTEWERVAKRQAAQRGCRQRKRWAKDFERSIHNSRNFSGRFRVKYVDWSCGKSLFGGWWYNRNFVVDATVRQRFLPRIKDKGRELEIGFDGSYSDNVPKVLKNIAAFFASMRSVNGILGKPLSHLGQHVSSQLHAYRRMVAEIERFRVVARQRIGLLPMEVANQPSISLDLVLADARFDLKKKRLLLHVTLKSAKGKEILPSQACALRQSIVDAMNQGERIGPSGQLHVVENNESLWRIAEHYYGNGAYFHLLSAANGLGRREALAVGQELRIEPLSAFLGQRNVALVGRGESLWSISGGGAAFEKFISANRSRVVDPNLVYPLQVLDRTAQAKELGVTR